MLGFNVVAVKIAIRDTGPMTAQAIATMIAVVVLFSSPSMLRFRRLPTRVEWRAAFVVGLCLTVVCSIGLTFGVRHVDAGLAALLMSSTPIITLALASLLTSERYTWHGYVGIACGILGVGVVSIGASDSSASLIGVALVLMGATCWSLGLVAMRTLGAGMDPRWLTGWQMFLGVFFLVAFAIVIDRMALTPTWSLAASLLYMAVFPKALATVVQMHVIRIGGTVPASSAAFLMPVFGSLGGVLLLGERIEAYEVVGAVGILAGIALVLRARQGGTDDVEVVPA